MRWNHLTPLLISLISTTVWAAEETREVDDFSRISYTLPFEVEFVQADQPFVTLEGDADTIEEIETRVKNGTLKIFKDNSWFDWSDEPVVLTVGFTELVSVAMAGSGDGYAEAFNNDTFSIKISGSANLEVETLTCNDLDVTIAGSGDMQTHELSADDVRVSIAGSGNVDLAGRAVEQKVSISGSGDHNAAGLQSQEAEINIAGSGNAEVWVAAALDVSVVGSGDVLYYGEPKVEERVIGSGDIEYRGKTP